jgi:YHS domain-containing protein
MVLYIIAAASMGLALPGMALAAEQINTGGSGLAIKGFDTVAYFTLGKPVKGKKEFAVDWKGAKWFFSSREHMEMFEGSPERYAPQYGGY